MTIFGIDISEYQEGIELTQAKAEGIEFAIIRTTDGTYRDGCYRSHLVDAESTGMLTAAYHYLRNPSEGSSVSEQVQASLAVMGDMQRPIWLDCETDAGLSAEHIREAKQLFEDAGVKVIGVYSYVPWWEGRVIDGEPDSHEFGSLWVAAYGANGYGTPPALYPGDNHSQWDYPLGNQRPSLWQFGSNATVADHTVDINAYRGSAEELRSLFYGTTPIYGTTPNQVQEELTMADVQEIKDFIGAYVGPVIQDVKDVRQQVTGGRDSIDGDIAASYPGWDANQLIASVRDKGYNHLTAIDMMALLIYGTDADRAAAREVTADA